MIAGGLQRLRLAGVTDAEIPESLKTVEKAVTERGPGAHPMSGPIFVEGAEPGDTLEVRLVSIEYLHTFGVNAFAARLPSALAALLTVLLTYELGRRLFGPPAGLLAGLVLASTALFSAAAHFANPDALLNLFTVLTLLIFWLGFASGGRGW